MKNLEVIRPKALSKILSVSLPTLWRMEQRGDLPKRVSISERAVGWLKSDIEEWLESKKIEA
ncbi:MAG: AlpA family phage regulatory protein [Balneola sp.]|jgi:prophage regulatory protein|nr:AlpA family phage regulatory protein [Balneola sp.]MBO6652056.1 AlpA family phage regulatory protein [Balneola sp.]MBO6712461.1 AlpA family phage regulatory protein [Balneola sp.]MBO6801046.1 AlpA family phage regulatory protein [Balneola sp.]MBO6870718.1 AlpA family phage regulatory protein [Balneola sp.]